MRRMCVWVCAYAVRGRGNVMKVWVPWIGIRSSDRVGKQWRYEPCENRNASRCEIYNTIANDLMTHFVLPLPRTLVGFDARAYIFTHLLRTLVPTNNETQCAITQTRHKLLHSFAKMIVRVWKDELIYFTLSSRPRRRRARSEAHTYPERHDNEEAQRTEKKI